MDFVLLAMNQIVNMASKMHYMYGGAVYAPIVIRSMIGKSWGGRVHNIHRVYTLFL
jgi:pyruvate/2-oxoglutarate/acetoin dehydrogenase E1 component